MDAMSADPTRVSFDLSRTVTAIASMLGIAPKRVRGAVDLLSDGCTIPFIARYRKESTGGLNEVQIGAVEDALAAATELIDRKNRVVPHINVCTIQPPAGQPRRGKRLRMCSCPRISGEVVYRSVDGRLHGPRFWWGACSTAAGPTSRC